MTQGWITAQECEERFPGWLAARGELGWRTSDGKPFLDRVSSRFGGFEVRVWMNPDDTPNHDKGVYFEAPNQNTIVWGFAPDGRVKVAVTEETRALADNPDGSPADPPITYGQPCVMGFYDKIFGSELGKKLRPIIESGEQAAIREAFEEAGVIEVISGPHFLGVTWPNATNTATVTSLYEMQVDLGKITENPEGREWPISRCLFLTVPELMQRIMSGWDNGICYRMGQANNAFFSWLSGHPEFLS